MFDVGIVSLLEIGNRRAAGSKGKTVLIEASYERQTRLVEPMVAGETPRVDELRKENQKGQLSERVGQEGRRD